MMSVIDKDEKEFLKGAEEEGLKEDSDEDLKIHQIKDD